MRTSRPRVIATAQRLDRRRGAGRDAASLGDGAIEDVGFQCTRVV